MTLRFGTDGVRGHADELTDTLVVALGRAAASVLAPRLRHEPGAAVVVGRDPRESGPRIEAALVRGLQAEGVACELLGIVPTPVVAWVCAAHMVPGVMISASHNPFHDNGIKFFAAGGRKLSDATEAALEAELDAVLSTEGGESGSSAGADEPDLAPATGIDDVARYELAVVNALQGRSLQGMRVVLDCANGAASEVGPRVLLALGAEVTVLHAQPDGRNINRGCGSTHPADLQAAVVDTGAQVGLAFDGDADRVLAVDELGRVVDGDHLIAMAALDLRARRLLAHDTVVVTVMTNLGFRLAMEAAGITVVETPVGDRAVLEAIEAGGFSLGGEQSGHVIFRDLASTGDGVVTGVQVLDLLARSGRPLSELADAAMTRLPQVLRNVPVTGSAADVVARLAPQIAEAEARLGPSGRLLVRASGTEPLVRVMVEASDHARAESVAAGLAAAIEAVLEA